MAEIKTETKIADRKPGEVVFNGLMLLLSVVLLWKAIDISGFSGFSEPGTFPMSAALIMLVFSSITLMKSIRKNNIGHEITLFFKQILPPRILVMMVMVVVFSLTIENVGFLISSFVLLTLSFFIYYKRNVLLAMCISIAALIVVYIIFRLVFLVILPEGIIPESEILAYFSDLLS